MNPGKTLSIFSICLLLLISIFSPFIRPVNAQENLLIGWDFSNQLNPVYSIGSISGKPLYLQNVVFGQTGSFGYITFHAKAGWMSWGCAYSDISLPAINMGNATFRIKFMANQTQEDANGNYAHTIFYIAGLVDSYILNYAGQYSLVMSIGDHALRYDNILPNVWYDIAVSIFQDTYSNRYYLYMIQYMGSGNDQILGIQNLGSQVSLSFYAAPEVVVYAGASSNLVFQNAFSGSLAFAKIYSTANNPELLFPIIAWWHFDEQAGATTSVDSSGMGNNIEWKTGYHTGGNGLFDLATKTISGGTEWLTYTDPVLGSSNSKLMGRVSKKLISDPTKTYTIAGYIKLEGNSVDYSIEFVLGGCAFFIKSGSNTIQTFQILVWGSNSGLQSGPTSKITDKPWALFFISINNTGNYFIKFYAYNGTFIKSYSGTYSGTTSYSMNGYYGLVKVNTYLQSIDEVKILTGFYPLEKVKYNWFSPYENNTQAYFAYPYQGGGGVTTPAFLSVTFDPAEGITFTKPGEQFFVMKLKSNMQIDIGYKFEIAIPEVSFSPGGNYKQNDIVYAKLFPGDTYPVYVRTTFNATNSNYPPGDYPITVTFYYSNGSIAGYAKYKLINHIGSENPTGKVSANLLTKTISFTEKDYSTGSAKPCQIQIINGLSSPVVIKYEIDSSVNNVISQAGWSNVSAANTGSSIWNADHYLLANPVNFTAQKTLKVYARYYNITQQQYIDVKILETTITFKSTIVSSRINKSISWSPSSLYFGAFEKGKTITNQAVLTATGIETVRFNVINNYPSEYQVTLNPSEISPGSGSTTIEISITASDAITNYTTRNLKIEAYDLADNTIKATLNITCYAWWHIDEYNKELNCNVYLKPAFLTLKYDHGVYEKKRVEVWLDDRETNTGIFATPPFTQKQIGIAIDRSPNFRYYECEEAGGIIHLTQMETVERFKCYYLWFEIAPRYTAGNQTYKFNVVVYVSIPLQPEYSQQPELVYKKYLTLTVVTTVYYSSGDETHEKPYGGDGGGGGGGGEGGGMGNYSSIFGTGSIIPDISGTPTGLVALAVNSVSNAFGISIAAGAFIVGIILIGIFLYAGYRLAGTLGLMILGILGLIITIMLGLIGIYALILTIGIIIMVTGGKILRGFSK